MDRDETWGATCAKHSLQKSPKMHKTKKRTCLLFREWIFLSLSNVSAPLNAREPEIGHSMQSFRNRYLLTSKIPRAAVFLGVALVLLLLLARPAAAQLGSGTLSGKVVDASTKKPLADVVVTATSPALQGEQTVVTDKSGSFRIPTLPPGDYALRYEIDTFRPYSRGGIQLRATVTLRVDAELLPETL